MKYNFYKYEFDYYSHIFIVKNFFIVFQVIRIKEKTTGIDWNCK